MLEGDALKRISQPCYTCEQLSDRGKCALGYKTVTGEGASICLDWVLARKRERLQENKQDRPKVPGEQLIFGGEE